MVKRGRNAFSSTLTKNRSVCSATDIAVCLRLSAVALSKPYTISKPHTTSTMKRSSEGIKIDGFEKAVAKVERNHRPADSNRSTQHSLQENLSTSSSSDAKESISHTELRRVKSPQMPPILMLEDRRELPPRDVDLVFCVDEPVD
mmetsp:Transcript_9674/g.14930  ORF Transcript_9674/g.14930 Transcript_9674/m.14930 type:complete len:145 (-) Transcript_9674:476-910(-)